MRKALEITPKTEVDKVNRIRLNMDRWRWLPRDLGERYIIVNVPAYTAALVENGVTVSRHRAVAGALKTQTPQLMATATGMAVAIPALLLHAFMSRKAKGIIGSMEQTAVCFVNGSVAFSTATPVAPGSAEKSPPSTAPGPDSFVHTTRSLPPTVPSATDEPAGNASRSGSPRSTACACTISV